MGRKDENSPLHPANLLIFLSICIILVRFIPFIWVLKLPSVVVLNNGPRPRSGHNKMVFLMLLKLQHDRNWGRIGCNCGCISCNWPQFCAISTRFMMWPHLLPWLLFKTLHSLQHLYLSLLFISLCLLHFQSTLVLIFAVVELIFVWGSRVIQPTPM
jgi:hypothetical protein